MSLLNAVLRTIETAESPLCVADIARTVDVDANAVTGMLDLLARKGKLRIEGDQVCPPTACGECAFSKEGGCSLAFKSPTRFEVLPK